MTQDNQPSWQTCPDCDEFWCNLHQKHVFECDCPPIEEWDHDPYAPLTVSIARDHDAAR